MLSPRRLVPLIMSALSTGMAIAAIAFFLTVSLGVIGLGTEAIDKSDSPQYDWNVYAAGADQLAARTLYREPLVLGDAPMPVPQYNLPPLSAVEALPLRLFDTTTGGVAWQVLGMAMTAVAAFSLMLAVRAPRPAALGAVALGALAGTYGYRHGLLLGTNNLLMLGLVALVAASYARGHYKASGLMLGLAIATKVWPVLMLLAPIRDRRWQTVTWCLSFLVVQAVVFAMWLGPDVIPDGVYSLSLTDQPNANVIGISALRESNPQFPVYVGPAIAAILVLVPSSGVSALGYSALAGLLLIPNLWVHYLPTVLWAASIIVIPPIVGATAALRRFVTPLLRARLEALFRRYC